MKLLMKLLVKLLKFIILLPILPIRLGWKWSEGAKISHTYRDGKIKNGRIVYSEEGDPFLGRLIGTAIIAGLMYYGIVQGLAYVFAPRSEAIRSPVVEQQKNVEQSTVNQ